MEFFVLCEQNCFMLVKFMYLSNFVSFQSHFFYCFLFSCVAFSCLSLPYIAFSHLLDNPSQPAGNAFPNKNEDTIGLYCKSALLSHGQLVGHQSHEVLLWEAAFQQVSSQHVKLLKLIISQVQIFSFLFVQLYGAFACSLCAPTC